MSGHQIWNHKMPLGRFLNLLSRSYYGALVKKLEHLEIEHYYSILISIDSCQAANCRQQYLCDMLQIDKASMVKRINYLAKKGYVQRCANPQDRREYQISLTAKAKEIMPEIYKAINELNIDATQGLDKAQKEEFYQWLWKVYDNIATQPAHEVTYKIKRLK